MDEFSSLESPQQLFGGSECEINFNALGSTQSFDKVLDSHKLESHVDSLAEPVLPKNQFDRFLGHAFLSVAQPCDIKMPWEKGVFAQIFGEDLPQPQLTVPCPQLTALDSEASDVVQDLFATAPELDVSAGSIFPHAISCFSDKDYSCKLADLSRRACDKWLSILVMDLQASEVGRNLATLGDLDAHRDEVLEIISAVIGVRSCNTAVTRANSILKFLKFILQEFPSVGNPFQENLVWKYFHFLKCSGGATAASTTLSAFRYAKYIMGFYNLEGVLESRRLKGYSELLYSTKRKLQQAQTLSIQQVKILHAKLEEPEADSFDREAAGFMLLAIYGRCRASDLAFLDHVKHDHNGCEGFVEIFTAVHKTGRSAVKKSILLPSLVPAIGITGNNWAARFGMSWPDRAILGRHQSHTNETVAIYSRDLAVGPVSRFAEVLSAIGWDSS